MTNFICVISTVLQFTWDHLFGIHILLAFLLVFFERRDPKTIWTWLLLFYFIPIPGFLLYLLIGQDLRKSRMFRNKELEDALQSAVHKQEQRVRKKDRFFFTDKRLSRYHDLVMYNLSAARAVYTDDNEVEVYTDGKEYFSHVIEEIKKAK